ARVAGLDRIGGVDANVSNLSVVSFPATATTAGNATAGNATAGNATAGDATAGDATASSSFVAGGPHHGDSSADGPSADGGADDIGETFPGAPAAADSGNAPVTATRLTLTPAQRDALARDRNKAAGRRKALDRSRRAANPAQYRPSTRQQARAARRAQAGLPVKQIHLPGGERLTQARGKRPARPHRH
ncbi:hypothetical protein, partial [Acrocarpospora sp. B8E8]|uniref:hypothetical protein n=1 Tax=Acrocarpospora sp. B8E8 TaxID=3153572 RepID=UPI00325E0EBE